MWWCNVFSVNFGQDIDAETAERWGYLNRIFEADQIGPYVDELANRIASFSPMAVRLAKQSVNNAEPVNKDGYLDEAYYLGVTVQSPEAQKNMRLFVDAGGQSRENELRIGEFCADLGK